ncbi:MAG: hypothetical protein GEU75_05850 [Dehalococcoidia bacterium]|nr:hypothetical protein [Dehalococcoidia bacterium]
MLRCVYHGWRYDANGEYRP